MNYIKLFDNFNPNHYSISFDEIDESLLNGIDAILAPISDDGYKYNYEVYDKKRLEISIYVEGRDTFTEKSNIIIGSEIKEAILTLLDFLQRRTGNEPGIWSRYPIEDLDDLREGYDEIDTIKIVVLLNS